MNPARHSSSTAYLLRTPPSSAPREVPTPLVFASSSSWDANSRTGMSAFASWYAERGYTCLEIDLGKPEGAATSEALMSKYESELASHIRLLAIPFAPVIVSRAGGTLIAQTYISSHPATGLLLISPPSSNAAAPPSLLPTPLPEFDFEARFPCAVMCTEAETAQLAEGNRLWQDPAVDKIVVQDEAAIVGQDGVVKIEQWLDDLGI
ncbi:uncharacterized protein TRAVEDRAFT_130448 [Trametes versicolor FP-101664 SS1]|uniref:uncharacterized protein n=1 Tax=Trametes versicolor (strain FP-101664) TaxID=717944 RepID=UPI0004622525|nr:uncharacterized protein TRAVEDRAFT_130448 [Trametes versicolor FP-101664 SS1]EIW54678.1 hypothetical protein TRAVEDRAFT_130448 [Trametes versicolor FP-101664 SS1]